MPRVFVFLLSLLISSLSVAQAPPGFRFGATKTVASTTARLASEVTAIAPGQPFTVALELVHPDGWHSYYQNSGGLEKPPAIAWTLPAGFNASPIQWPVPEVKDGVFGKSFVYSGSPVFLVAITPPATLKPDDSVTLQATVNWQICQQTCRDESAKFSLSLPVAERASLDPAHTTLFAEARAKLPKESDAFGYLVTKDPANPTVEIRLTPAAANQAELSSADLEFIPDQPFVRPFSEGGTLTRESDTWVVTLKQATRDVLDNDIPLGETLSGIFIARRPLDSVTRATTIRLNPTRLDPNYRGTHDLNLSRPTPAPPAMPAAKFAGVIGGLFLGGLILNLMPCVFPVIGLKILGFVQQAGADRKKIVLHGLIFAFGVLLSFWALSGILFALRAAALAKGAPAEAVGWGFQLQIPGVVLGLMLLMFALALNLYGVFEIGAAATSIGGSLQAKQGLAGTFFSGVLATIVATPCSGPLLGVALGAAIGLPAPQFFAAFTAMALGLALPYLVLSIFPKLVEYLPRPGAWMESFKQAMAFLLFATTGYLLWVYTGQIGLEHMLGPVFGLSLAGVAAWIYGRWSLPHRSRHARITATVLALALATGGVLASLPPKPSKLVWETWSEERVESLLKQNKPVFVDFTAQWCATCQVNKKRAYSPDVIELMHKRGIVALRADKTNPNPAIEKKLAELQRAAIPVNVYYRPGKEPVITPELLSADYLLELFKE
jgi:DsbC/DsbD-like thiol-disulfide interchange protein/cytochrome c biogenesis protein CcdA